ncbi:MAG: hypothetical protein JSR58_06640 [Verrucomicrobia bacterium]|nr:hypothetical protein [Verrucomicrobiota bacterium]
MGISLNLVWGDNQTDTISPILPSNLPFRIKIEFADFSLPMGVHSYASAIHEGKYLIIAGRISGAHPFNGNFPPTGQNTFVFVVDPKHGSVAYRSLADGSSGLTQAQIDLLSVTSPQSFQSGNTLYICGGYGIDTASGQFNTKNSLTAVDIPGLIHWVTRPRKKEKASSYIRQTFHPLLQVAGGYMDQINQHLPVLLVFGQNFTGSDFNINGIYSEQVRRFRIIDNGRDLYIKPEASHAPDPNFHRRDLNVVPVIRKRPTSFEPGLIALSGLFTQTQFTPQAWTVPVEISKEGHAFMPDPNNPLTFKQGMNNYVCANLGLYSKKHDLMYLVLMGGISYGYFDSMGFEVDAFLGYINQVTTIQIDKNNFYQQFIMPDEYPTILNPMMSDFLRFGAGARFFPSSHMPLFENGVIQLDKLDSKPVLLGYIVGGIVSPAQDLLFDTTSASAYIFKVIYEPL